MIVISWENLKYPSAVFSLIKIEIGTGEITETLHPRLLKLGEFVMGNDDPENEHFIFPGRLSVDFAFPAAEIIENGTCLPSVAQAYNNYLLTLESLQVNDAVISVYRQGEPGLFYTAGFNKEDTGLLSGSNQQRRISIMFLDDYTKLSEEIVINKGVMPHRYPGGGTFDTVVRLGELIKTLFVVSERQSVYSVYDVSFFSKWRFRLLAAVNPPVYQYFYLTDDEAGLRNFLFFRDDFETKSFPFKILLQTLVSFAVIDFTRKLRILPLWYDGGDIVTINRNCIEEEDEIEYCKKYEGMTAACGYTDSTGAYKTDNKDYGLVIRRPKDQSIRNEPLEFYIKNEKDVFKLDILFSAGGNDSNNGLSRMLHYISNIDGISKPVKADAVSYMKADGTWSEEKSLAEWAASLTWEIYHNKSRKYKATLPGINYSFQKTYAVEGLNGTYRPVYMAYDFENDQTRIIIRENTNGDNYLNPTSIHFNRILRAFDYAVTVKKKSGEISYQYSFSDGAGKSTAPDIPYISTEQVIIKIRNVYNCSRTSAVEYDGIRLSVANHDMKLWRDNWTYIVYIAIGKSRDTDMPASSYPVNDDANADWFLLNKITDEKINDAGYYYEFLTRRIVTTNPFWIWAGLKSSSAPLFENIPVYAR